MLCATRSSRLWCCVAAGAIASGRSGELADGLRTSIPEDLSPTLRPSCNEETSRPALVSGQDLERGGNALLGMLSRVYKHGPWSLEASSIMCLHAAVNKLEPVCGDHSAQKGTLRAFQSQAFGRNPRLPCGGLWHHKPRPTYLSIVAIETP